MTCLSVTVGGISFVDTRPDGTRVSVDDDTGWDEGGDVFVDKSRRGAGHGDFAGEGERGGREFVIGGLVKCPDHLTAVRTKREFASLLASGMRDRIYIAHEGDLTLWADVQLDGRVSTQWAGNKTFSYRIPFYSPDAFRYGETSTASTTFATDAVGRGLRYPVGPMTYGPPPTSDGTVTLTNFGSAPASPLFTVDGPGPAGGFSILDIGTGKRLTYLGAIPDGGQLVLDAADGSVLLDGTADRSSDVISMGWPVVGPGETATFRFAPEVSSSLAVLTVSLTSCYW